MFWELLAETLRHNAFFWMATEHFVGDYPNLAGIFSRNSVCVPRNRCALYYGWLQAGRARSLY